MKLRVALSALFAITSAALTVNPTLAQDTPAARINCGDVVEAELTKETTGKGLDFQIIAAPGTTLTGRLEPIGAALNLQYALRDGNYNVFSVGSSTKAGEPELFDNIKISASNPTLSVSGLKDLNEADGHFFRPSVGDYAHALGAFTIYLGCVLRDGTPINPGDNQEEGGGSSATMKPFSGTGFPGLPSVDFADAISIPLQTGTNGGKIPPTADTIIGYTFDATTTNTVDLSFTRVEGNLNLGLVVLSPNNEVVFQSSLVTANTLTATFTIPSDGTYTIGIFRIDLLPPATPEATSFQIEAVVK